jgi:pSer/pThr/pTyr-binding forkhead associated (FHA) protein
MVSAELKVIGGKHAGQVIPLNRRKFLIGREQDCQLRPNSDMVSRHHCVFSVDDFSVRLRDLGSTNGTLVNGERIRKDVVLSAGDRVVIGNLEFEVGIHSGVSVPDSDSKSIPSVTLSNEDTQVTSKTVLEVPALPQPVPAPVGSQTASIPVQSAASPVTPAVSTGDTVMMNPGQMMPGQYPYPQMMPQMGYPGGMYGGYPYQPMMPGYGQMYPQMMPQMMPQMGYPMQVPSDPHAGGSSAAVAQTAIEVALPDPETTGAKESDAQKGSSGASTKDTEKPTGAADAIIKQYMGRRPAGS